MAQRRMFSPDIVCSDAFLEMPVSSRDLYVQLAMKADDDGFISPRSTMRMLGASEDDLKVLLSKRFLLPFESGVVVVKHWLIHNLIRADLYKETLYKREKALIGLNENGAYTELREGITPLKRVEAPKWLKERRGELRTANVPQTARRLGKGRIDTPAIAEDLVEVKDTTEEQPKESKAKYPHALTVFSWFPRPQKSWESMKNIQEREYAEYLYARGEENVRKAIAYVYSHKGEEFFPQVNKPSDLEKKWLDIADYATRQR